MAQKNSEGAPTPLIDSAPRPAAGVQENDLILDLDRGEIDLTELRPVLEQSFLGQSVQNAKPDEDELEKIIARSVFGLPEPVLPSEKSATRVTIRSDSAPLEPEWVFEGEAPQRSVSATVNTTVTATAPAATTAIATPVPTRRRQEPLPGAASEPRQVGTSRSGVFYLLIAVFSIGLIGAAVSTAVSRFTQNGAEPQPASSTQEPVTTTVPTTQPTSPTSVPTSSAPPPSVPATTITTPTTIPTDTALTVPDISFPRPSWAPDPTPSNVDAGASNTSAP